MIARWLSIIGIGEDGISGLGDEARLAITNAELIIGGGRHLDLIGEPKAERLPWPSPLQQAFPDILNRRSKPVVVLATGDPFYHGIGSLLAEIIDPAEMNVISAPSAYVLAAARMGWAGQDCCRVSLHGRTLENIIRHLHPGRRILALSWDATTPQKLSAVLTERGFGLSTLTVLEALGGPKEKMRSARADTFDLTDIDPLNTIAINVKAESGARVISFASGLPDDFFEHDGQLTKRDARAITLTALQPLHGQRLWDIGAGAGSIAIEWMLRDHSCCAIAIEASYERVERIRRNAFSLGTPDLEIVHGHAPEALGDLPEPDAIFIGGGATEPGLMDTALARLKPGGRLVANGVTLETQALLFQYYQTHGGELIQHSFAKVDAVGSFHALKSAIPILQWTFVKPRLVQSAAAERPLSIGMGCTSGVTAEDVIALLKQALAGLEGKPEALYTIDYKQTDAALEAAAQDIGLRLIALPLSALAAAAPRAVTQSAVVQALFGIPSVAECAALAGAGENSRLLLPRISANGVTCAIATSETGA